MVLEPFEAIVAKRLEDVSRRLDCEQLKDQGTAKAVRFAASGSESEDGSPKASPPRHTIIRSGHAADQGQRRNMEDAAVTHDSLVLSLAAGPSPGPGRLPDTMPDVTALYAVFDGHCGSHAAEFASSRILEGVTGHTCFPADIPASLADAFMQIDQDYLAAISSSAAAAYDSAGTTALAAVVWGSTLYVANAGDSRAVLSRHGKAIELTRDHKPQEPCERRRIELCGGYVCSEGRLCGELAVARAIGDFHLPQLKGGHCSSTAGGCSSDGGSSSSPLTAEPEVTRHELAPTDEFVVLGCDGLWDVISSQRAVELARQRLREHNDPQRCAQELVAEALRMHSGDNVTVIVICFVGGCCRDVVSMACSDEQSGLQNWLSLGWYRDLRLLMPETVLRWLLAALHVCLAPTEDKTAGRGVSVVYVHTYTVAWGCGMGHDLSCWLSTTGCPAQLHAGWAGSHMGAVREQVIGQEAQLLLLA
ncbi:phosphatase 2C-like domain-containing protein [Scenedesmus sp. NREL 46B-D3]|nr:phosphatase 2C-like domain-containing protein [Scenedesmus sp. NREL 46B-D3]